MGIFDSNDPKVTEEELKKASTHLRAKGFSEGDMDDVQNLLHGAMKEGGTQKGITEKELKESVDYLKKHKERHDLSSHQIDELEKELRKRL